ncbi:alpha/beta hydrolase [Brevundimonas sp.]|uniref:alpha/beta hydrolase n=1 Tax=Brevundimonas sp. TaxID=1871086 RepID=UPI00272F522C|nr:alpha/beta fold hydrolase [Brevundimonas sp.]MDP1913442.1 alpha/beta fold hydrolase [Brevundimonas sp.]
MLSLILAALLSDPVAAPVVLPSEPAPLHGTLLAPEGSTRAVALIIAGSGPTDRDGNSPLGVSASSYRLLAEGLAAHGVATVRADKRGVGASAYPGMAEADLRFTDYSDDARAWAAEAARLTGQPCAWLIGHSEGALVALAAVARGDDAVCGLVLLSGAGRPVGAVLREQLANAPEPLRGQAMAILAELEAGRPVTDVPPQLAALFRPSVQPYMISWLPLDPAEMVAAWDGPVMIGQGTTDIQVGLTDARALAAARPDARLAIWEGVNHQLKIAPADRAANLATYSDPTLPLAPGVVDDVAGFILQPR